MRPEKAIHYGLGLQQGLAPGLMLEVNGFYKQFDDLVDLYDDKFARPSSAIMAELYKAKKLTAAPMDEKLEWTYFELWHHRCC